MKLLQSNSWILILLLHLCGCDTLSDTTTDKKVKGAKHLILLCENGVKVNPDNVQLNIYIINVSPDTLVFPMYRMPKSPWFNLTVLEEDVCCGIHSQMVRPKTIQNPRPCFPSSDDQNFELLSGRDTIFLSYSLNDIGYFPVDSFQVNKEYTYFVEIEVPSYEVNVCANMWTGSIRSNLGSFIIE